MGKDKVSKQPKLIVHIFLLLGIVTNFVWVSQEVYAASSLPSGIVIADDQGLEATSEGTYFIDLKAVRPGDQYTKTITIRSLDLETPITLGLLAEKKAEQGDVDWSQQIELTLELDGAVIYKGPLLGDGSFDWSKQPLSLGKCRYGTDKILIATFDVNKELTNEELLKSGELEYYWTFIATKEDEPTSSSSSSSSSTSSTSSSDITPTVSSSSETKAATGRFPRTGEEIRELLYKILVGILLVMIILLLWKKARERKGES